MDRMPKAAPFPVGTRVRYIGTHRSWYEEEGQMIPISEPGMVVEIKETRPGRRGTLTQLRDQDGPMIDEDTEEPIRDETQDGYSVYYAGGKRNMGRIIRPDTAHEWEPIT